MDSLISWYLFGLMSWIFLLVEYKRVRFPHLMLGLFLGFTGVFAILVFLLMQAEGLFEDPPIPPPKDE